MSDIFLTIVVAVISGGLAGAAVSWWNAKQDRDQVGVPTLNLQREQFEHQRTSEERSKEEAAYREINDALSDSLKYLNTDLHTDSPQEIERAYHRLSSDLSRVYLNAGMIADPWVMWYAREAANSMQAAMEAAFDDDDPQPMLDYMSRAMEAMRDFQSDAVKGKRYTFAKHGMAKHNRRLSTD